MDEFFSRIPALTGWATTWVLLLAGMYRVAPKGHGRTAAALIHLATAMPLADLVSGRLRGELGLGTRWADGNLDLAEAIDAAVLGIGLHALALVIGGWFAGLVFHATEEDGAVRDAEPEPRRAPRPNPKPRPTPATIRPASGTVAATVGAAGPAAKAEDAARAEHLLAMLEEGSDFHRVAACRALVVPFEGARDERVGEALLALIEDSEVESSLRAEATIALGIVFGSPAPNPDELRESFSAHVDKRWLDAVRTDVRG